MGYKMKYTNGKKADTSAFPFKVEQSKAVSDSPAKFTPLIGGITGGVKAIQQGGSLGEVYGRALTGSLTGGLLTGPDNKTVAEEKQYEDVLKAEGLERGFWGKLGFGGGKSKQRAQRIEELKEQDQMGIDRERIESRGGVTAGAGA
jgi:hypothetical protein